MALSGINMRSSSGHATDGTGQTYLLGDDAYPTTRGGQTFGYIAGSPGPGGSGGNVRDRDPTTYPELAGLHFTFGTPLDIRIDLPATDTYNIHLALGDTNNLGNSVTYIYDDGTLLATIDASMTAASQYGDATEVMHSTGANWVANEAAVTLSFATMIMRIVTDNVGTFGFINHIAYEAVDTGLEVTADSADFPLTGSTATVKLGLGVDAIPANAPLTGSTASVELGLGVVAVPASMALAGSTASITVYSPVEFDAIPSNFPLVGSTASVELGLRVVAVPQSLSLVGSTALVRPGLDLVAIPHSSSFSSSLATVNILGAANVLIDNGNSKKITEAYGSVRLYHSGLHYYSV